MNEDSWLEAAYEDRNGGDVDTADVRMWFESYEEECDRTWDGDCEGDLVSRTTAGGFHTYTCEGHLRALQATLDDIAQRYPEINHPEYCTCYGCSEGSY